MILSLKNVSKSFSNTKVLQDINLELKEGEILTILGASGSGKSTLLNIIAGFEKVDSGDVSVYDKLVDAKSVFVEPHERNIGFVFQNYALFPHLNVYKNIIFGISSEAVSIQKHRVDKMLELTGLQGLEDRYPHELSGGQQQRVALARTLATKPKLILFDEAFSNVDSILKSKIEKELVDIIKKSNISAVFVTHDSKEALSISDKIAYLENGKIKQFCSACDMYNKPSSKSVGEFFAKANFIEKNSKTYCIRPEECKINESTGKIKAKIIRISYLGERQELEVVFNYENIEHKFTIYADKNLKLKVSEYINFDIDWQNVREI